MEVVVVIVFCLVVLTAKGVYDRKVYAKKLRRKVVDSYGARADRKLDPGRAQSISYFCSNAKRSDCCIDDITWNDLDMDRIYYLINSCKSSIGDEYLYYLLRNPVSNLEQLKERNKVIEALAANEELRTEVGIFAAGMGSISNISVYEYISKLKNVSPDSTFKHVFQALLLIASLAVFFVNPVVAVFLSIAVFAYNIVTYFKRKSEIECYFTIFAYILRMLSSAENIGAVEKADTGNAIGSYCANIRKASAELLKITRGAALFVNPVGSGDLLQTMFDYIRMAFHIDLIKFNSIVTKFSDRQEEFDELFENIGFLDCMLAVASYREWAQDTSCPELCVSEDAPHQKPFLNVEEIAHPLLEEPVTNSINLDRALLLTGSNASGKSTFLKTLAINAVLAQSIFTVRAEHYSSCCFKVMSSIALRDDLESGESYFVVEIKSLKRILDEKGPVPVLCFIDEVLRGTNTVERIAASTEILKALAMGRMLPVAATHDIELTYLLEDTYRNCHFEEKIENKTVLFDYRLREGRTTTRNAIRLLAMMGFDENIVSAAVNRADVM